MLDLAIVSVGVAKRRLLARVPGAALDGRQTGQVSTDASGETCKMVNLDDAEDKAV